MNHKVLLALIGTNLLAACAAPQVNQPPKPYVAPVAGSLAKLQIRSNQVAGVGFFYSFDDQRACKGNRLITNTSRASENQLKASTSLRADEPASIWFSYLAPGNRACNSVRTFKPINGRNYLAYASGSDQGCNLYVQDITDPANPKFEPTFFVRTYTATLVSENPHCAAVDVDAQIVKARKPNLSGLKMEDLKNLLPAADKAK